MLDSIRRWLGIGLGPARAGEMAAITVRPIGVVSNSVKEPRMWGWENVESKIAVREELAGALDGLEGFSHIVVLFWLHQVSEESRVATHIRPLGDPELPLQGVFATRSQLRPNPIGLAVVPLLGRKGNVLRVKGLDAIDGTPVLDLKPYVPHYDSLPQATIPDWAAQIAERRSHARPGEMEQRQQS